MSFLIDIMSSILSYEARPLSVKLKNQPNASSGQIIMPKYVVKVISCPKEISEAKTILAPKNIDRKYEHAIIAVIVGSNKASTLATFKFLSTTSADSFSKSLRSSDRKSTRLNSSHV